MKVSATVRANSKFQKIERLSEYLDIPKSRISIEKGHTSKNKVILIE
ncbi:MAG: DUF167 domain-containing protein [Candidatus Omnitrophica bacterium]|nr:DUF167 domain-containing protein [Candidatus Omnitrophota bacterium]